MKVAPVQALGAGVIRDGRKHVFVIIRRVAWTIAVADSSDEGGGLLREIHGSHLDDLELVASESHAVRVVKIEPGGIWCNP